MIKKVRDEKYEFLSCFNTETGGYICYDTPTGNAPFMASFPHLIDVGVMSHCLHGQSGLCLAAGIKCYQDGMHIQKDNMSLSTFKKIIDEGKYRMYQVALGGRGDVDQHENFEELLQYSRDNNVVPNFTTSGLGMTQEKAEICKKYCGAVAVSMYSRLDMTPELAVRKTEDKKVYGGENDIPVKFLLNNTDESCYWDAPNYIIDGEKYDWDEYHHMCFSEKEQQYEFIRIFKEVQKPNYTLNAIKLLLDAGVKTNIHYVLSNSTIDEALLRLKYNGFPKGINAVVFLLHKPVGMGTEEDVLKYDDPRVKEFFELIDNNRFGFKIGFDSCSIPGILNFCHNIDENSIDTCEGGRFSMYIDAQGVAVPCSFDNQDKKYGVVLSDTVCIEDAWNSPQFEEFRNSLKNSCPTCSMRENCMGGCPLQRSIVLCAKK